MALKEHVKLVVPDGTAAVRDGTSAVAGDVYDGAERNSRRRRDRSWPRFLPASGHADLLSGPCVQSSRVYWFAPPGSFPTAALLAGAVGRDFH